MNDTTPEPSDALVLNTRNDMVGHAFRKIDELGGAAGGYKIDVTDDNPDDLPPATVAVWFVATLDDAVKVVRASISFDELMTLEHAGVTARARVDEALQTLLSELG